MWDAAARSPDVRLRPIMSLPAARPVLLLLLLLAPRDVTAHMLQPTSINRLQVVLRDRQTDRQWLWWRCCRYGWLLQRCSVTSRARWLTRRSRRRSCSSTTKYQWLEDHVRLWERATTLCWSVKRRDDQVRPSTGSTTDYITSTYPWSTCPSTGSTKDCISTR